MIDRTICYTVESLAHFWACSTDMVYDLLKSGKLIGFKLGREWRITEEARINYERDSVLPTGTAQLAPAFRGTGKRIAKIH